MAKLGETDEPLMNAISSAAIKKITEFEAFDMSILAWAFDVLGLDVILQRILPSAMEHFSKDELWIEEEYGMFWFDFANVVGAHTPKLERHNFDARFQKTILNPVTRCLVDLSSTHTDHTASLQVWQEHVEQWQIPYVGPLYSNVVLAQLGVHVE